MGVAQSEEDVREASSRPVPNKMDQVKRGSPSKNMGIIEAQCGVETVPEIPTGRMKDFESFYHRPPPTWIPPEPRSQELTKEQRALIQSMIKTPSVEQTEPASGEQKASTSGSTISSPLMHEFDILKETIQELKDILENMEEPMRQLKNEGFWQVQLFTTCEFYSIQSKPELLHLHFNVSFGFQEPATKVQEKLNTLLCVSERLQNFSDPFLEETAKKYLDNVFKIKSLSDKLVLTLSRKEAARSVDCYKVIVEGTGWLQQKLDEFLEALLELNVDHKGPEQVNTKTDETPCVYRQQSLGNYKPFGNNAFDLCESLEWKKNKNIVKFEEDRVKPLETVDLNALMEKKTFYHSPRPSSSTDSKDFSFQNSDPLVFQQILSKFCEDTIKIGKTYFKNLKFDSNDGSRAMALRHFMKVESDILNFQMRTAAVALNCDDVKDFENEFFPIIPFELNEKTIIRHQENMKEMMEKIRVELGILEKRFKKKTTIKPLMDENLNRLAFYILSMYNSNQELKVAGEIKEVLNKSYAFSTLTWMFRLLFSMETQETLPETSRTNFEECIESTKNRFDIMNLD
ncbi:hypothetical protein CAEBREN_05108 [Caenorhabditis brenneri]|uniref:Uncharacterized protein n=1 Tax=Caenorhabditis brenneri TaxID=135651 RepID=G0NSD6_CAEBE|nr:hypothetical protein CAEBREN_05108 [Caenorhabditis brenneri]